jgi:hypothetical protein
MEMIKQKKQQLLLLVLLHISFFSFSQTDSSRFVDKGLLRAQGGFGSGTFISGGDGINTYLHGDLEYYLSPNVSVRSESYYFLSTYQGTEIFSKNHSNFAGIMYHFNTKGHLNPYIGFQPGITYSQLKKPDIMTFAPEEVNSTYLATFNPLMGFSAGINYYAPRFFHLFMHLKYVTGKHLSDRPAVSLNELKVTFGLGWNLWIPKEKRGKKI